MTVLTAFGYGLRRQRGSHAIFAKPGAYPLSVPIRRPHLGEIYVRKVTERLCSELEMDGR